MSEEDETERFRVFLENEFPSMDVEEVFEVIHEYIGDKVEESNFREIENVVKNFCKLKNEDSGYLTEICYKKEFLKKVMDIKALPPPFFRPFGVTDNSTIELIQKVFEIIQEKRKDELNIRFEESDANPEYRAVYASSKVLCGYRKETERGVTLIHLFNLDQQNKKYDNLFILYDEADKVYDNNTLLGVGLKFTSKTPPLKKEFNINKDAELIIDLFTVTLSKTILENLPKNFDELKTYNERVCSCMDSFSNKNEMSLISVENLKCFFKKRERGWNFVIF